MCSLSAADVIKIEILKDGTIKSTTNPVSAANHDNAEQFLAGIAFLAGGETTREARTDVEVHEHHHHDGTHHHHH